VNTEQSNADQRKQEPTSLQPNLTFRDAVIEAVKHFENQTQGINPQSGDPRPPMHAATLPILKSWLAQTDGKYVLMLTNEEVEVLTIYLRSDIAHAILSDDENHPANRLPVLKSTWLKLTGKDYPKAA
jgi:hypothetical protein